MAVVGSGVLSSLGTTGTTQLTDKVDSPHSGLFKALHNMAQGNVAVDFGGTDASGNFGFSHAYSWSSGVPSVTVQGGVILHEGKRVAVADSSALTLTKPSSGAFYHWITVNSGGTIGKTLGTSDGVVPDIPAQTVPISLIKVQSTDSSGDLATQFFTTTKQSNSVSIGYDNSEEYAEAGNITGTSTGVQISSVTGIGVAPPDANAKLVVEGAIGLDEISAPTATADYGKIWTQTDNNMYFQDGAGTNTVLLKGGKHTIWVPAAAMYPETTNGCSSLAQVELSNGPELKCLDFADGADDHAQFTVAFPKSWNEGTVTFEPFWTVTGTNTGTVAWGLAGTCFANDATLNTTFSSPVVTTALAHSGTSNDLMKSNVSGDVTIQNAAVDTLCIFQIMRDISADTQSGAARLLGIKIYYTIDSGNDA